MKELYVVGLGPGNPELLTVKAMKVIKESRVIFVPYSTNTNRSLALSVISPYLNGSNKVVQLGFPMGKDVDEKALSSLGDVICKNVEDGINSFVTLGDPSLYSTYFRVAKFVNCVEKVELIPGISSITACACKGTIPLALGDESIAVIPANRLDLISFAKGRFETIVVLKGNVNLDKIAKLLSDEYTLIYARRCYLDGEKVTLWDSSLYDRDYFSMLIGVRRRESR